METFFMFGKYTSEAVQGISAGRTAKVREVIERRGGQVKAIYALLGEYDVVIVAALPRMADAMKVSVELKACTGISFFTAAAIAIEEFDSLFGESG